MIRLDAGQIEVVDDAMAEILKRKRPLRADTDRL
jgi:hypothetical protein